MNVASSWFCLVVLAAAGTLWGQKPAGTESPTRDSAAKEQAKRFERFEELLSGAKLVGRFTVLGRDAQRMPKEEYTIQSVTKMSEGDYWLFQARVKYGQKDVTLPLPLEVKWAGDTPIISLTELAIPGLGTFSSRVVLYNQKYAGTWTHGDAGGHLFGTIEQLHTEPQESPQERPEESGPRP